VSQPASQSEYEKLFMANQHLSGSGIEGTTQHLPCPWCGAADWMVFAVVRTYEAMQDGPRDCSNCHRSGMFMVQRDGDSIDLELVQTGGPAPPLWLDPAPRRVS
jgi:hypothetical protein